MSVHNGYRVSSDMWLHDCGCIEMAAPYRVYPCAEHRADRDRARDYGALAAIVSCLVFWAGFIYILAKWAGWVA